MQKLKIIVLHALLIVIFISALQGAEKTKSATGISICTRPPMIDGNLSDACWKNAVKLDNFHIFRGKGGLAKDTQVYLTTDKRWLYFGVVCKNEHMRFLNQLGRIHDELNIFKDDSFEIFLSRQGLPWYYHFILNFANVHGERRVTLEGGKDLGWNLPWISATAQNDKQWSAEIAIPLYILNCKNGGNIIVNFLRNKINVTLDNMGAKLSEQKEYRLWNPIIKTAHDPKTFGIITKTDTIKADKIFLPFISKAETGKLNISGNEFSFNTMINLRSKTPKTGTAKIDIHEINPAGKLKTLVSRKIKLPPRANRNFEFKVPVNDFSGQRFIIRLTDNDSGMRIQDYVLKFSGDLLKNAFSELNYYTKEKIVRIKCICSLDSNSLKNMTLRIVDTGGKVLADSNNISPDTILSFSLNKLNIGKHTLKTELRRKDGKVIGKKTLFITKRPPSKGSETKVDHFRRIVLYNGKPYFPYGIYTSSSSSRCICSDPELKSGFYKRIVNANMNTIILSRGAFNGTVDAKSYEQFMIDTRKYNLKCGLWGGLLEARGCEKHFKSNEENKVYTKNYYNKNYLHNITRVINKIKNYPNLVFYYGLDEPNLHNWEVNLYVQELFYRTQQKLDPYHVMFGLFARSIPPVPYALDCMNVVGYDIYTYPNWERSSSKICDNMAALTIQLDARAAKHNMPVWVVPMAKALDPYRSPRVLTSREQICQSYTAIIYGAKGLLYFCSIVAPGKDTWETFKKMGRQIKQIEPAIMNYPVFQKISYSPGSYSPERWNCPDVNVKLFKFPDGCYLFLAVNGRNYPVDVKFNISGLISGTEMFTNNSVMKITKSSFNDKFSPYKVKVYKIMLKNPKADKPVNIKVRMKTYPKKEMKLISNEKLRKAATMRKNHILNPSFEMPPKVPGFPDFYYPYRILELEQAGQPGSRWHLDKNNPKFGNYSLRMHRYPFTDTLKGMRAGVFGTYSLPSVEKVDYTFSIYARGARKNAGLWCGIITNKGYVFREFKLDTKWKRYSFTLKLGNNTKDAFLVQPSAESVVWIDGLQLEKGKKPTAFSGK